MPEDHQTVWKRCRKRPDRPGRPVRRDPRPARGERLGQNHPDEHALGHLPPRFGVDLDRRAGGHDQLPARRDAAGHRDDPPALQAGRRFFRDG